MTYKKRLYAERKAWGRCPQCGRNPPTPGYRWCADCRDYSSAMRMAYRARESAGEREERLARHREQAGRLRAERRQAGLCIMCGTPLDGRSASRCRRCLKRAAESQRRRRNDAV